MNARSAEQMQIIGIFIAMVASVTMFAAIYSYVTVEVLSTKIREATRTTRMKRDSMELAHTKKLDSLLEAESAYAAKLYSILKMWGER